MARVVIRIPVARRQSRDMTLKFVRKVLEEIKFKARLRVSYGPYTTGSLARSIERFGPFPTLNGVEGSVGSDLDYARAVEKGTGLYGPRRSKYPIRPVRARALRFYWRKVGSVVYFDKVSHPGQQGKNYLTDALREVARRHGLRVTFFEG